MIILVVHPNRPILFSVEHSGWDVKNSLEKFRKIIKGKKFLFIELVPRDIEEAIRNPKINIYSSQTAAYKCLVAVASKAALKVIALDDEKIMEAYQKVADAARRNGVKIEVRPEKYPSERLSFYEIYNKREKAWLKKLEGVGSNAVVVMHPAHASEIAKQLKIPKENIVGQLLYESRRREIANKDATNIETIRLKRRMEKAKRRMRPRILK